MYNPMYCEQLANIFNFVASYCFKNLANPCAEEVLCRTKFPSTSLHFPERIQFSPSNDLCIYQIVSFPLNSRQLSASQGAPLTFFIWEKKRQARGERERATRIWARLVWMSINHRSHSPPFDIFWYILIWKYKGVEKVDPSALEEKTFVYSLLARRTALRKAVSEWVPGFICIPLCTPRESTRKIESLFIIIITLISAGWTVFGTTQVIITHTICPIGIWKGALFILLFGFGEAPPRNIYFFPFPRALINSCDTRFEFSCLFLNLMAREGWKFFRFHWSAKEEGGHIEQP